MIHRLVLSLLAGVIALGAVIGLDVTRARDERAQARADAEERVDEQAERLEAAIRRAHDLASRIVSDCCRGILCDRGLEPTLRRVARSELEPGLPIGAFVVRNRGDGSHVIVARACDDDPERVAVFDRPSTRIVADLDEDVPTRADDDVDAPLEARRRQTLGDETGSLTLVTWVAIARIPDAPTPTAWLVAICAALFVALTTLAAGSGARRDDGALEAAVARVGKGDLDVTLDGRSATASAFNRMTRELKDTQARLAKAERIAAWRDIARRIAHEIKNPLTPIKVAMETLRKTHARKHPDFDEIFEESTRTVLEETARLEKIVTEFSRFARMPRPKAESIDVVEVVEKVVAMHDLGPANATLPDAASGVRVELRVESATSMPSVRADREQLTQVLVNLVQNACDAAREKHGEQGGRVVVTLSPSEHDGVRIVVSDNGPGIPADARAAVLEPYYTTKSSGTGLGLAIVDRIVSDHGGVLSIGDDAPVAEGGLSGAAITIALRREGPSEEAESSVGV